MESGTRSQEPGGWSQEPRATRCQEPTGWKQEPCRPGGSSQEPTHPCFGNRHDMKKRCVYSRTPLICLFNVVLKKNTLFKNMCFLTTLTFAVFTIENPSFTQDNQDNPRTAFLHAELYIPVHVWQHNAARIQPPLGVSSKIMP